MATEYGIVENADKDWAWVKATRSGACSSCGSRDNCQMIQGSDQSIVKAKNTTNAKVGDKVELYLSSATTFKCVAIVYLLPVAGLLIGALSSGVLSEIFGLNPDFGMFLFTVSGLILSILVMRSLDRSIGQKQDMQPTITRIIARSEPKNQKAVLT